MDFDRLLPGDFVHDRHMGLFFQYLGKVDLYHQSYYIITAPGRSVESAQIRFKDLVNVTVNTLIAASYEVYKEFRLQGNKMYSLNVKDTLITIEKSDLERLDFNRDYSNGEELGLIKSKTFFDYYSTVPYKLNGPLKANSFLYKTKFSTFGFTHNQIRKQVPVRDFILRLQLLYESGKCPFGQILDPFLTDK